MAIKLKYFYCYECHTWFRAEPGDEVRCPHCGKDVLTM